MRGKKPKEGECYVLRMNDGTLVAVNRESYLEWHRSRRREKYQRERCRKYRVYSLDRMEAVFSCSGNPTLEKYRQSLKRGSSGFFTAELYIDNFTACLDRYLALSVHPCTPCQKKRRGIGSRGRERVRKENRRNIKNCLRWQARISNM